MSTREDMAYDAQKEREYEDAPVLDACPHCHGPVKDYGNGPECRDCGETWPDKNALAAVSASKQ